MPEFVERFSLTGKQALVTGGSRGIGREIARVLADAGADIGIIGRDRVALQETSALVQALGRECLVIEANLANVEDTRRAGQQALDHFGTVDVLVNNAGIALVDELVDLSLEDWEQTMAVNLRAPFLLSQMLAPAMIRQRAGKIIHITSQAGVIAIDQHAAYAASKAGLNMLTRVMCSEWGKHNIQVNAIAPTVILTPMGTEIWGEEAKARPMLEKTPLGRFGKPVEVADLVLFLASSAADLITGETILIDGGYTAR